ncbi:exopolysaccharide production protein ExoZ [Nitratireductor aquimarinus]|uniref:acyltransferase family protein n=1 Tax=Nitratireductor aquimarinus TaxID=889300 RepID=UPI003B5CC072
MSAATTQTASRLEALDGLRAVAAIVVLAFHARMPGFGGGFVGVDIFFVLSGFLITSMIKDEIEAHGRMDYRWFMWRRFARLFPALLLFLAVFAAVAPWLYPSANVWNEVVLSGAYLSNYAKGFWNLPDFTHHSWSLAVEMQFYLVWPFVVIWLCRLRNGAAISALLLMFVAATLWRVGIDAEYGLRRAYYPLDTRMSGLVIGGVLAFAPRITSRPAALILGIVSLCVLAIGVASMEFRHGTTMSWAGAIVDVASAALIASLLVEAGWLAKGFSFRPLVAVGLWSYALYLWHYPVARLARDQFDGVTSTAITLVVSLVLAALTYYFYERHVSSWLRNYRPNRVSAPQV